MNWKQSDLRAFIVWFLTFFEEDNGKASTKRVVVWALSGVLVYALVHMVKSVPIADWTNSLGLIGVIWGFITTLLGLTYITTRNDGKPTDQK